MMTREKLAAIRARCTAATPGDTWLGNHPGEWYVGQENKCEIWADQGNSAILLATAASTADAEFIAHAREDVPRLLDELEAARINIRAIMELYKVAEEREIYRGLLTEAQNQLKREVSLRARAEAERDWLAKLLSVDVAICPDDLPRGGDFCSVTVCDAAPIRCWLAWAGRAVDKVKATDKVII